MKFKIQQVVVFVFLNIISFSCQHDTPVVGCTDPLATNYDNSATNSCSNCCTYPPKQGGVLFWSENPSLNASCGAVTVTISNGKQTTINGFYSLPPINCINQVGGYVLLDVGTYDWTITFSSSNCIGGSGKITVTEGCNLFKID